MTVQGDVAQNVAVSQSNGADITHFQIFGERRSGTNYVHTLLQRNLGAAPCFHYGWKHGYCTAPAISRNALIVVVVRDPLDWVLSFYSRQFAPAAHLDGLSFSDFIRAEWDSKARPDRQQWDLFGHRHDRSLRGEVMQLDRHPIEGRRYRNVLEMRRIKLAAHLGFRHRAGNVAVVRYEDARRDPASVLTKLAQEFAVPANVSWVAVTEQVGPPSAKRKQTRQDIAPEDLDHIRSQLDLHVEAGLGYDVTP
ncbi:hypothetical protein E4Z66_06335 [Aliishimia ponticola]|uniref:Uncharacterized protein n=1 Tax=Aliishimia ponticola TaxID=2499833 RepID=A0A4S4NDG3_9RHOB|nr:sulfotransferase domain-containing protein [Aliishimia ponticola]THH36567.1 hypothetical protein E4Z66_06335 [Aliishimia ponticola]